MKKHPEQPSTRREPLSAGLPRGDNDGPIAQRRALLRAAAAGAPVALGLASNSALAQTSLSLAEKDAQQPAPPAALSYHDGWMRARVPFGVIKNGNGDNAPIVHANVFKIDEEYWKATSPFDVTSQGTQVFLTNGLKFIESQDALDPRLVLVLFGKTSAGTLYNEGGKWPKAFYSQNNIGLYSPLQGLHCSSWTSATGMNNAPYPCTGA